MSGANAMRARSGATQGSRNEFDLSCQRNVTFCREGAPMIEDFGGVFCQDLLRKVPTPPKLFIAFTGMTERECFAPVPLFGAKILSFKPHALRRAPCVALGSRERQGTSKTLSAQRVVCVGI